MKNSSLPRELEPAINRWHSRAPIFGMLIGEYGKWLYSQEYSIITIKNMCSHVCRLEQWLKDRYQVASFGMITPEMLVEADSYFRRKGCAYCHFTCVALHRFLNERQLIPKPQPLKFTRSQKVVSNYATHLREVRGFTENTIKDCCHRATCFLNYINLHKKEIRLLQLDDIESFLKQEARKNCRVSLGRATSSLRGFLRFEFQNGVLLRPLHEQIEMPLAYAGEKLPRVLTRQQVYALLNSIDQKSPHGLRDFTMIYLIAAYGLRSSEVVALKLDDIDWRSNLLRIKQTKTRREITLPLTDDVANVLVRYLKRERSSTDRRDLFLKSKAPMGPMNRSTFKSILYKRVHESGLKYGGFGFHAMRHSLAIHLLRRGVSVKSIGDTLGHRSIKSTGTYLRLDLDDLRTVGLSVPGPAPAVPLLGPAWRSIPKDPNELRGGIVRPKMTKLFRSAFAQDIERFLTTRRTLGRKYYSEEFTLLQWDKFLYEQKATIITQALFDIWANRQSRLCPRTQNMKLNTIRRCLAYVTRFNPRGFVPNSKEFPKSGPIKPPRLVSALEMSRLLAAARNLMNSKAWPIRSYSVRIGLTLLFCCGLRVGELLRLKLRHYQASDQVLRIEDTKFNKFRLVPLTSSVAQALEKYLSQRRSCNIPSSPDNTLIWCGKCPEPNAGFGNEGFGDIWKELCFSVGILDERGHPPRLHDLRHSFACEALNRWYKHGDNPQSRLPYLATYLGHSGPASSLHYLHLTPSLRSEASNRFHRMFGYLAKTDR